ncbi:MAG: amidohydrolase [Clostridiales Family XIII bacterium]|jgi:predicted amidohydrolase YtcJ|nr:amidohydrolase [Clostridiales Family XIII bacterium]
MDTLYFGGPILTMEPSAPEADWVLVRGGKIEAVGAGGQPLPEGAAERVDLAGNTMLPGLYDAHCHVMPTGLFLNSANLLGAKTIDETLALLSEQCLGAPAGEWVFGGGFMSQNVAEGRYPTRQELDRVSADHPIMLAAQTLHGGAVNTRALGLVQVPDVAGVGREPGGGLDGTLLSDDSFFPVMSQIMALLPEETLRRFIDECAKYGASKGTTSIVGLLGQFVEGDTDVDIIEKNKGAFPVDFTTFYQTWDLAKTDAYGLPRIGGCLTLDGAGFEYTMALSDVYPERPERRGFLIHTDEEIYTLLSEAHRRGIQTAFHALGDRAIDQLLFVFKQVIGEQGQKDLRHRVEHFSLAYGHHMDMAAELGLVCSMQPAFSGLWGAPGTGYYDLLLGRDRAAQMEVFPEILARGGVICGGSDSPVTLIDPLYGIACLIDNPDPRRNVPVTDAIKIFTVNAAYSVHQEQRKGSIKAGKDADFTVIDKNPYDATAPGEAFGMRVVRTIKGGLATYERAQPY